MSVGRGLRPHSCQLAVSATYKKKLYYRAVPQDHSRRRGLDFSSSAETTAHAEDPFAASVGEAVQGLLGSRLPSPQQKSLFSYLLQNFRIPVVFWARLLEILGPVLLDFFPTLYCNNQLGLSSQKHIYRSYLFSSHEFNTFAGCLTMTVPNVHAGSAHLLRLQPLPSPHLRL